jgi:voltage-gated potassium channel
MNLSKLIDVLYRYRFYLLLFALILNFFVPPLTLFPLLLVFFRIITTIILLFAGANFIKMDKSHLRNRWFIFGFVNIIISFISELFPENTYLEVFKFILLAIFFIVITVNLLQQIFSIRFVTVDVIIGSFCGYLLIGIISFYFFNLIDYAAPDSFSGLSVDFTKRFSQLFYFSFTCMTTIGFGDILPLNMLAQKFAVLTACIGQFYIAVVVAILVSRFMNRTDSAQIK